MISALALCAALLANPARPAAVCTCIGPRSGAEAVRHNDVVFEGRVVRRRRILRGDGIRGIVHTFTVTRWRKGAMRASTIDIVTGEGGGDCGVIFDRGRTHTVYASRGASGDLGTSICSGPYLPAPAPPPPSSTRRGR